MKNILLLENLRSHSPEIENEMTLFQIASTLSILITGKVLVTVYIHFHVNRIPFRLFL